MLANIGLPVHNPKENLDCKCFSLPFIPTVYVIQIQQSLLSTFSYLSLLRTSEFVPLSDLEGKKGKASGKAFEEVVKPTGSCRNIKGSVGGIKSRQVHNQSSWTYPVYFQVLIRVNLKTWRSSSEKKHSLLPISGYCWPFWVITQAKFPLAFMGFLFLFFLAHLTILNDLSPFLGVETPWISLSLQRDLCLLPSFNQLCLKSPILF